MSYSQYKKYKNQIKAKEKSWFFFLTFFVERFWSASYFYFKIQKHSWNQFCHNYFSIYKITLTSIFLVLSVSFSLIEIPSIYLPWGAEFDYRIFDSLFLFIAVRMIGVVYALTDALLLPWIHVMIDGEHSVIAMVGFMASNFFAVFLFWLFYYKTFRLGYAEKRASTRTFMILKVIFLAFMALLASCIEAGSYIFVFQISMLGTFAMKDDDTPVHTSGDTIGLDRFFHGLTILYVFFFFVAVFLVKYIFEFFLFGILEKRICKIANHYFVFDKSFFQHQNPKIKSVSFVPSR